MTNLNPQFCRAVALARRCAKLSQSELAAEVGCKQSALSMFERGDGTKLNDDVINKLAKRFSLKLSTEKGNDTTTTPPLLHSSTSPLSTPHLGFCSNPDCPSNLAYSVAGRTLYLPDREKADPVGARYCALCGEVLERYCPNCGAPVHAGAICSHCGEPYIAS